MSMVTSLSGKSSVGPALARMKGEGNVDVALRSVAWDVANGRYGVIQPGPQGGMTLVGTGGTDGRGPMAAPAVVSYTVVDTGGLSMLVRRERKPAEPENGGFGNVVLAGVEAFSVTPVRLPKTSRVRPTKAKSRTLRGGQGRDLEIDEDTDGGNEVADQHLQALTPGARPLPRALRVRLAVAGGRVHEVVLETGGRGAHE